MQGSLASLMIAATQLAAQGQTGTLVGRVTDSASAPVASAMLHVRRLAARQRERDDGRYRIVDIAPGQHSVVVRRQGFATDTFTVTIAAVQTTEHDMVLRATAVKLREIVVSASPRLNETPQAALDKQRKADNIVLGDVGRRDPRAAERERGRGRGANSRSVDGARRRERESSCRSAELSRACQRHCGRRPHSRHGGRRPYCEAR